MRKEDILAKKFILWAQKDFPEVSAYFDVDSGFTLWRLKSSEDFIRRLKPCEIECARFNIPFKYYGRITW